MCGLLVYTFMMYMNVVYGLVGQTQVWCRSSDGPYFILLSSIKCHVAYCTAEVDFGRYFGMQTVFVVSLLSNLSLK